MTSPEERAAEGEEAQKRVEEGRSNLSRAELEDVEDRLRLRAAMVYEIIRQEGREELERSLGSLWWSGLAAGLSIGFSVVAQGLLIHYLPDAPWRPLLDSLGYSVGFVIVILAREQLFTENTLTAVLPLVAKRSWKNFLAVMRLWGVVLAANLVGGFLFALGLSAEVVFPAEVRAAFLDLSRHLNEFSPAESFFRAVVAGWLVATLVWLLPSADQTRLLVIVLITYLIALADLAHVIAGSVEIFLLLLKGETGPGQALFGFFLPALAGNIVGGSALFALIAWAQVREEI